MPKATPAKELDQRQSKVINGVQLRQHPAFMVIPTAFISDTNLSVLHRMTLLLFYTLCAYEDDGVVECALDELQHCVDTDLKTLRAVVNDLEKHGSLNIERRRGLPSRYSIPEGLGLPGDDVRWLSTGEGDWKKRWRW